ncbi:ABC transporter substrate-binding protein [Spiribacter roseus]|uniref:ABC transporter substrate-binding protein n=1 Tax=Spiribacter roseus TaxID=1855875 RepID=UPI0013301E2C|nr:ABC transporter substrate-binding protein [Spiribacter roseus]KAF0281391.1 glycine/betaine ABC transporter substrate-binding protein [Spiribacter roseus]
MSKRPLYALVLAGAMAPMAANAECGEVSVAEMNWTSGGIMTGVTEFLLEQGYGCDVTVVPSATTTAITSLAENNEPDIVPELWVNSAPLYFELAEEGKVVKASDAFSKGGTEHWLVPSYLVEENPELGTIEGILNNPELVDARFHNCPDGWGCRIVNDSLKEAFDLEGNGIEVFNHGSGETLQAAMASAYEAGEPYFGYYWGPTAPLGKYDFVSVDLGPYNEEVHDCNQNTECNEVGVSSFPSASVFNVVTADLAEREPEAFELMQNVTFDNDVMNGLLAWHTDNEATVDEAVVYFLQNNQEEWMSWLSEDARSNLQGMF